MCYKILKIILFTLQKNKDATIITLEETKWGENKDRLYKTKKNIYNKRGAEFKTEKKVSYR